MKSLKTRTQLSADPRDVKLVYASDSLCFMDFKKIRTSLISILMMMGVSCSLIACQPVSEDVQRDIEIELTPVNLTPNSRKTVSTEENTVNKKINKPTIENISNQEGGKSNLALSNQQAFHYPKSDPIRFPAHSKNSAYLQNPQQNPTIQNLQQDLSINHSSKKMQTYSHQQEVTINQRSDQTISVEQGSDNNQPQDNSQVPQGTQITTVDYQNTAGGTFKAIFTTSAVGDLTVKVIMPDSQNLFLTSPQTGGNNPIYESIDGTVVLVSHSGGGSVDLIINGKLVEFHAVSADAKIVSIVM